MRNNLKAIAEEIVRTGMTLNEAQNKYDLSDSSKSNVKRWLMGNPEALRNKTKKEMSDEKDEWIRLQEREISMRPPRPVKRVCIRGKWYTDVTADFIDCGD